jgi:hypothetical protein
VVEVGCAELDVERGAEAGEGDEECCGIGAAGDGDDDVFSETQNVVATNEVEYAPLELRGEGRLGERGGDGRRG